MVCKVTKKRREEQIKPVNIPFFETSLALICLESPKFATDYGRRNIQIPEIQRTA